MGSLSRRANSEPVSGPLQASIRFFQLPAPAPPTAFLAVGLPARTRISERLRAFARAKGGEDRTLVLLAEIPGLQVPLSECVALGISYRPGGRRPRAAITRTRLLPPCRLARPVSPFWPLYVTIPVLIYLRCHGDYRTLSRVGAPRSLDASRRRDRTEVLHAVSGPLFIQGRRFIWRYRWSPLMEREIRESHLGGQLLSYRKAASCRTRRHTRW